jgi:ubiquinone/menaquinone biosynthesis C-methylase UbiE
MTALEQVAMDEPMPDLWFIGMSLLFKVRDLVRPRAGVLKEVGIRPGFHVLDYGCGPGGYISAVAQLVGAPGQVYALDIHPQAIQRVRSIAGKKRLANVETILSDCRTGLPNESIDVVLLYDTFHSLSEQGRVLEELHRVLKPSGILSFSDHHMKESEILPKVKGQGLFGLSARGKRTYSFLKNSP